VYATTLVELVRAHHGIEPPAFASLSVGRRSELEHRVSSITHPRRDPSRRRALFAAALSAMILLVLPLSAVQRAAREASEPSSPAGTISTAIDCRPIAGPDFDFREMSGTFTDGPTTVHYFFLRPAPDRCLEASFSLNTAFTDDDRDVVPAPGLEALVHETSATFDRVVRITEADGSLQRSYSIDGKPAPWDASAQQWYGSLMPEIIRRTSAGLQPRALRIVDRGGADALFDEVTAIPMTSVRRDYLAALLSLRSASEVPRARIIEAGAIALRDYEPEQANLLAEIAKREASDETVRAEVLGATGSLRDIANRKTVLEALAAHRDFAVRYAALEALPLLSGDIWKRTFLESAAPLYLGPDRELYEAFLDSANAIEDPAEREQLKEALLRYDSSPEMQSRLNEWAPPGAAK
jgi:hypothetical protein